MAILGGWFGLQHEHEAVDSIDLRMWRQELKTRYWLFTGIGSMPKGGIKDLIGTFDTLTSCINTMIDRSGRGLVDWWQIYDAETNLLLDSKEPHLEKNMKQIGYVQGE